jgi:V/A-type H+-transporting ATPase subunit I
MIVRMAKVEILGLKDIFLDVVDCIHQLGTLHIEDLTEQVEPIDGEKVSKMEMDPEFAQHLSTLGNLRARLNALIQELKLSSIDVPPADLEEQYCDIWSEDVETMVSSISRTAAEVEEATRDLIDKKQELCAELSHLEKYAPIMEKVQPLTEKVQRIENMASIALIVESKYKNILSYLNDEIGRITKGESQVVSEDVDEETTAAIVLYNQRYKRDVHDFLAVENVNQVRLPTDLARKPIDEAMAEVKSRIDAIPAELENVNRKIDLVAKKYCVPVLAARDATVDRLETMEAVPKFLQTDRVFVINGWLPVEDVEEMRDTLKEGFEDQVTIDLLEVSEHEFEEAPVKLENGPFTRYFEAIYMLSKYPRYGTIDPTIVFAIFFPIFLGIMVGDIGYGIIIMIGGWLIHRKLGERYPLAKMVGYMLTIGGAWIIFFGILYFEFFGDLLERAFHAWHIHLPLLGSEQSIWHFPINRLEAFTFMLFATCAVGLIHISIGLIIGIVNGIKERDRKHIIEKAGTLVVLCGLPVILASFRYIPKFFAVIGVLMMVGGAVAAAYGAGMGGLIESVVGAGNILSYARLLAIGLASVILAQVANDLCREMWGGFFGIVIGILIAIILHTLNIVIGAFSPSIHSLRLHLVEFFTKFFEPAKTRYEPFRKSGGETRGGSS